MKGEDTSVALTDRPQKVGPPDGSKGGGPLSPAPRPYNWRVTLGLIVGIVVVAGAMGVFMRVIPTPLSQPTPTSAPTARLTAQPAVAPVAPAPATVAPTTPPVVAATPAATDFVRNQPATVAPAAHPTMPSTAQIAALQPTRVPTAVATTQATATPTAIDQPTAGTVDPVTQAEILDAYSSYWQVLADALSNLDSSDLQQVTYGQQLLAVQVYIDQLRAQGRAGRTDVEHSIQLVTATPEDAEILDRLIDRSVFIDPITKEPLPLDQQAAKPETEVPTTYYLRKIDGVWKVVNED